MKYVNNTVKDLKIAYIGGGSRNWAWGFMSDLACAEDISGTVYLYDIDYEAAYHNEIIGNKVGNTEGCKSVWKYKAVKTIGEALTGADFVIISILPGTFDEMESDVHTPEEYGIWQPVGDSTGPGGIVRALRTVPMYVEIAKAIEKYSPDAWVINYTNPMTVCVNTLYKVFPKIKAFGCCHEVFGTQKLLAAAIHKYLDIDKPEREDIKVNVIGVNHFTWITQAKYRNIDLFPLYKKLVDECYEEGFADGKDNNWINSCFATAEKVKMDLFKRFGYIAAAGDRHLAEFCPGDWYLKDPKCIKDWKFALTPVSWRKEDLAKKLERSKRLVSGEEDFVLKQTGEDGINQIRALLGLEDLVANVNIPNYGQIPNLPYGAVVETNARFTADMVTPIFSGNIPESIYPLVSRICGEQQIIIDAALERNLDLAFQAFSNDPLVRIPLDKSKELFGKMLENTKEYLSMYNL